MVQYKAFTSAACGGDIAELQHLVNEWMDHEHPRITYFAQTALGRDLVLSFVYERGAANEHAHAEAVAAIPDVFEQGLESADLDPSDAETPLLPEAELPY